MTFPVPFPTGTPHGLYGPMDDARRDSWLPPAPVDAGCHPPLPLSLPLSLEEARPLLVDAMHIHHQLNEYVLLRQPRLHPTLFPRFARYEAFAEFLNNMLCNPPPAPRAWVIPWGITQMREAAWGLNELLRHCGHPALDQLLTFMDETARQATALKHLVPADLPQTDPQISAALNQVELHIHAMERAATLEEGRTRVAELCTLVRQVQQQLSAAPPPVLPVAPAIVHPAFALRGPPPTPSASATPFGGRQDTAASHAQGRGVPHHSVTPFLGGGLPKRTWEQ